MIFVDTHKAFDIMPRMKERGGASGSHIKCSTTYYGELRIRSIGNRVFVGK